MKQHKIEKYTFEDFEHDLATIAETDKGPKAERRVIVVADAGPIHYLMNNVSMAVRLGGATHA